MKGFSEKLPEMLATEVNGARITITIELPTAKNTFSISHYLGFREMEDNKLLQPLPDLNKIQDGDDFAFQRALAERETIRDYRFRYAKIIAEMIAAQLLDGLSLAESE